MSDPKETESIADDLDDFFTWLGNPEGEQMDRFVRRVREAEQCVDGLFFARVYRLLLQHGKLSCVWASPEDVHLRYTLGAREWTGQGPTMQVAMQWLYDVVQKDLKK